jgi:CheY-like chemotaxis protein
MSGTRILVVDDDPWILKMVASVLERRGYIVTQCQDGEDAYHTAIDLRPHLVITDVMMPKVDGFALVRALRAKPEFAFTPFIFLTSLNSDEDRIKGFRLGADDYLPKPFRFEELDLRVERVIKRTLVLREVAREQVGAAPTVASQVDRPADGSGPVIGLLGSLEQIGLAALLTLLELERKTGTLTLWNERDPAQATLIVRMYLRKGRIIGAEVDGQAEPRNAECVYVVLEWSRGRFEFSPEGKDMDDEVNASITQLLLEGARLQDERNA